MSNRLARRAKGSFWRALVLAAVYLIAATVLFSPAGFAQSDALLQGQQLQQQFQQLQQLQRGGGSDTGSAQSQSPQSLVLQPAVPQDRGQLQPPSRLEQILSSRAGIKLQQFGYDQLGTGRAVTIPQTGAIQDDYVLGPGDEIVVSLRGQENGEYRSTVDRNGRVVLPRMTALSASGRTLGDFRADLEAAVHRAYVATQASVAVGRVRQISVLVSGEVNQPGQRLVTGLSSATDALLLSGGVRKTGSLRNVQVIRAGRAMTVDLYSVLTARGVSSNFRLADGDRVVVPPLGKVVALAGMVRQPGIFELPARSSGMSAGNLISMGGGQEVRGRFRLSLLRVRPDGQTEMAELANDRAQVRDSEILFVQLGADQTTSRATLSGGTSLAGSYPIVGGTRLSQVLKAPGALGTSPYTPFGIIVRKDPVTLMRTLLPITPIAVVAGREDMTLQSDDLIRVLSTNEIELLNYVVLTYLQKLANQQSTIRNPLSQVSGGTTLARTVADQSGQQSEIFDVGSVPANVQRQQVNALLTVNAPGSVQAQRQAEIASAIQQSQAESSLSRQQQPTEDPRYGIDTRASRSRDQRDVRSAEDTRESGQALPDGSSGDVIVAPSSQSPENENMIRESVGAGRFMSNQEVQNFGQLSRQLGVDPLVLMNFLVDNRVQLDGAVRGPGSYFVGPATSLHELVQAAGGTLNWADESGIELISTTIDRQTGRSLVQKNSIPLGKDMLASYVVRPRDQIRFKQIFTDIGQGSVTVQGEVRAPGSFPIVRGEHLSDLLARAGGLTNTAYPYGAVFLRQSVAQKEREGFVRAANEVQNQLIVAMTRIGNDKVSPETFASMQTFVNELRNQRGVGRISIVADPSVLAANRSLDPLLEAGDVVYIPPRPSSVTVIGQVLQPGSYPFRRNETVRDYIERAGGYSALADSGQTFVILPDGSARRPETSWFSLASADSLPPGSSIIVPRDITPLDLRQSIIDVSQIFSQFAVAIASVAVLSKQ